MHNTRKSRRVCGVNTAAAGANDRISDLHESVYSKIFSRLPIVDAVRTSILSKNWRYKWTCIDSIDVTDYMGVSEHNRDMKINRKFPNIVAGMLSLQLDHVKTFDMDILGGRYKDGLVTTWISAILRAYKNLETFRLRYSSANLIRLPQELLSGCTSLTNLLLGTNFILRVPAGVISFPNLTNLCLFGIRVMNTDTHTDTLVLELPALKECRLESCCWCKVKSVEFHAPALTTFRSSNSRQEIITDEYSIKIRGARLSLFHILHDNFLLVNFVLIESTVDCANLEFFGYGDASSHQLHTSHIRKLLVELRPMKHLIVTKNVVEVMARERPLRWYGALERLDISKYVNIGSLLELLNAMPKLKYLKLDANYTVDDGYSYDEMNIPSCITSNLEEMMFEYNDILANNYPFHLETFLLKNARKVKKVSVLICHLVVVMMGKDKILKHLSTSINASASPTIINTGYKSIFVYRRDPTH